MTYFADFIIDREGKGPIVPGSGGRHRRVVDPSMVKLVAKALRARLVTSRPR